MRRISVHWAVKTGDYSGNALGYGTHSSMLKKYCAEIMDIKEDSKIALHLTPTEKFFYIKGKFNILFTMWEFLEIPNIYIANFNRADAIIVPCHFCKELFRKYTNKPIYVCKEGIVPEDYPYYERTSMPKKFRFLWSGAPNQRKGYPFVLQAIKAFEDLENVEIYIKTTSKRLEADLIRKNAEEIVNDDYREKRLKAADRILETIPKIEQYADALNVMGKHNNVFFDTRKLPINELRDLYNSAHCFLLPTFGEGWGLTLCEAMATGCPSIATPVTGVKDFFDDDVGFGIKYSQKELDIRDTYGIKTLSFIPDTGDFLGKMLLVMNNYGEALRRGKKASERIHKKFTWALSAQRLKEIIEEIEDKYVNNTGKLEAVSR